MIEFTLTDGNPVAVNPMLVDYAQPADDVTYIVFNDGRDLSVLEDYDTVAAAIGVARRSEP